jgi:hypothetical protein
MICSTTTVLAAMLAMAPITAHAHAIMAKPVPFGKPSKSPLAAEGSNFPCQGIPPDTTTPANNWPVGSTQQLSWDLGTTAVHGGGSCQISVTTEKAPTKATKWKVIHSFEGGCPINTPGNLANDDLNKLDQIPHLPFQIPGELPNGDLIMAWTWFNKVGNREMYMDCAPVKVSGGASDTSEFDKLPDMAVANIGQGTCTTKEGGDYTFAEPGKYVTKGNGTTSFMPLCGTGADGAGGNTGAPAAPVAPAPIAPSQAPANPGMPTSAASPPIVSGSADITSTLRTIITVTAPSGPAPSQKPAQSPAAGASTPQAPKAPASQAPAAAPSQAPGVAAPSGAAPQPGQACSPDGSIVCSADGKQFAICNWGKAVFQAVASGTTCSGGKIAKRYDLASTLRTVYA